MQIDALALRMRPRAPLEAADLGARLCQECRALGLRVLCRRLRADCGARDRIVRDRGLAADAACCSWPSRGSIARSCSCSRAPLSARRRRCGICGRRSGTSGGGSCSSLGPGGGCRRGVRSRSPCISSKACRSRSIRRRVLQIRRRKRGTALLMTAAFATAETCLAVAVVSLLVWFAPAETAPEPHACCCSTRRACCSRRRWRIAYAIVIAFLEPFYVAAGFAMYLNRRAELEAWDVEQELRRAFAALSSRWRSSSRSRRCGRRAARSAARRRRDADARRGARGLDQVKADPNLAPERNVNMLRWAEPEPVTDEPWWWQWMNALARWFRGLFGWLAQSGRCSFGCSARCWLRCSSSTSCGSCADAACRACRSRSSRRATCATSTFVPKACPMTSAPQRARFGSAASSVPRSRCSIAARCRASCTCTACRFARRHGGRLSRARAAAARGGERALCRAARRDVGRGGLRRADAGGERVRGAVRRVRRRARSAVRGRHEDGRAALTVDPRRGCSCCSSRGSRATPSGARSRCRRRCAATRRPTRSTLRSSSSRRSVRRSERRESLGDTSTDAVVVLSTWGWDINDARRAELERWVEAGGRLVVDAALITRQRCVRALERHRTREREEPDDAEERGPVRSARDRRAVPGARGDQLRAERGDREEAVFYAGAATSTTRAGSYASQRRFSGRSGRRRDIQAARVRSGRGQRHGRQCRAVRLPRAVRRRSWRGARRGGAVARRRSRRVHVGSRREPRCSSSYGGTARPSCGAAAVHRARALARRDALRPARGAAPSACAARSPNRFAAPAGSPFASAAARRCSPPRGARCTRRPRGASRLRALAERRASRRCRAPRGRRAGELAAAIDSAEPALAWSCAASSRCSKRRAVNSDLKGAKGRSMEIESEHNSRAAELLERLRGAIGLAMVGQAAVIEQVVAALAASGHVLIEGVPGLGKTLLVRALAQALSLAHGRVQFTPDMMPSDITGHAVLDPEHARAARRARAGVHARAARGRDQSRAGEDAERAARGDAGVSGHARRARRCRCRSRSWCSRRRIPSRPRARIRCRKRSSTGSCSRSRSAIPRSRRRSGSSCARRRIRRATSCRSAQVKPVPRRALVVELQRIAAQQRVDEQVVDYAVRIVRATREWPGLALGSRLARRARARARCARRGVDGRAQLRHAGRRQAHRAAGVAPSHRARARCARSKGASRTICSRPSSTASPAPRV